MPPLVLFQTHRFLSSEKTVRPAASSSPIWRQSMQTNAMAPSRQDAAACPSVVCRKAVNGLARHFAGPHGELAMADAAEPAHVSIDRNIVGRISEDEIGAFVAQEALERLTLSQIPTQEPVAPEQPQVARPGHPEGGIDKRRGGVLCIVGRIRRRLSGLRRAAHRFQPARTR